MVLSRPATLFSGMTWSAPVQVEVAGFRSALIIGFILAFSNPAQAGPQRNAVCQGSCGGGCGPCPGSGYVAPPQQPYVAPPPQPSQAEIDRERGTELNNKAAALEKKGNWPVIIRLYEQALRLNPNSVIAHNLAHARATLLGNKGYAASHAGNYPLGISLQEEALRIMPHDVEDYEQLSFNLMTTRMAFSSELATKALAAEEASDWPLATSLIEQSLRLLPQGAHPQGLTDARAALAEHDRQAKIAAKRDTGTCAFGTTCSPPNPNLGGATENNRVVTNNATDQLKSAVKSGEEANRKGISDEEAKAKSNCQFDDKGCAEYIPNPPINKVPVQSPEAMGLADRIKKTTNDRTMAANLQWYLDLDRQVLSKQTEIAAVQKEIDTGDGDSKILNAHKKSLENDLARSKADQVNVVQQMKDQGQKLNITIDWNEAPSK